MVVDMLEYSLFGFSYVRHCIIPFIALRNTDNYLMTLRLTFDLLTFKHM